MSARAGRLDFPLRISARADYAVRAAAHLAVASRDGLVKGDEIARVQGTPSREAAYPQDILVGANVLYLYRPDGTSPVDADGLSWAKPTAHVKWGFSRSEKATKNSEIRLNFTCLPSKLSPMNKIVTVPEADLNLLRKFDTPTICNVVELFDLCPRTAFYMDRRIQACYPKLPPMVGESSAIHQFGPRLGQRPFAKRGKFFIQHARKHQLQNRVTQKFKTLIGLHRRAFLVGN